MRSRILCKLTVFVLLCFFYFSILTVFFSSSASADQPQLFIFVTETDSSQALEDNVVREYESYDVIVKSDINEQLETNVQISVPWDDPYVIGTEIPWVQITIPSFESYAQFVITATKPGFQSAEESFIVSKGSLVITVIDDTIEEGTSFTVHVQDERGNDIQDAIVYYLQPATQNFVTVSESTRTNGYVQLPAPDVNEDTEVKIGVLKDGFMEANTTATIINSARSGFIQNLMTFLPIIGATFFLIFAILFVRYRTYGSFFGSSRSDDWRDKFFGKKKKNTYVDTVHYEPRFSRDDDPVIEEIRIRKDNVVAKEGTLLSEKNETKKATTNPVRTTDMVHGKKDLQYTLDKITGKIDENGKDKWFEGRNDIGSKIDNALNKQNKKKTDEDDKEE